MQYINYLSYSTLHIPSPPLPPLSPLPSYTARLFLVAYGLHLFASITPNDIIYNSLPLYHTNGGILATGQMLLYGSTLVLRKKFSASNFFIDCVKHKCTVCSS